MLARRLTGGRRARTSVPVAALTHVRTSAASVPTGAAAYELSRVTRNVSGNPVVTQEPGSIVQAGSPSHADGTITLWGSGDDLGPGSAARIYRCLGSGIKTPALDNLPFVPQSGGVLCKDFAVAYASSAWTVRDLRTGVQTNVTAAMIGASRYLHNAGQAVISVPANTGAVDSTPAQHGWTRGNTNPGGISGWPTGGKGYLSILNPAPASFMSTKVMTAPGAIATVPFDLCKGTSGQQVRRLAFAAVRANDAVRLGSSFRLATVARMDCGMTVLGTETHSGHVYTRVTLHVRFALETGLLRIHPDGQSEFHAWKSDRYDEDIECLCWDATPGRTGYYFFPSDFGSWPALPAVFPTVPVLDLPRPADNAVLAAMSDRLVVSAGGSTGTWAFDGTPLTAHAAGAGTVLHGTDLLLSAAGWSDDYGASWHPHTLATGERWPSPAHLRSIGLF